MLRKVNYDSWWENEKDVVLWWYDYTYANLICWIVKATWGGMVEHELLWNDEIYEYGIMWEMWWCEEYEDVRKMCECGD